MTDGYVFLPWVRYGLLTGSVQPDPQAPIRADASVTLRLTTLGADGKSSTDDVAKPLPLVGPGDVIGIDPREVVRTVPVNGTPNFPPNLVACIEFDRPDFVWLFTPAAPTADTLTPWIVLAVVRKDRSSLTVDPNRPLPMLECPAAELPNLAQAALWAHAQYTGDPAAVNLGDGPRTISRLICPRQLQPAAATGPSVAYYACVVPTFEVGCKAGLGIPITADDEKSLKLAWNVAAGNAKVQLPVYYWWEFATGPSGDFRDLVDHLKLDQAPDVGPRLMDVSQPARDLGPYPAAVLGLPSALRGLGTPRGDWPPEAPKPYTSMQNDLRRVLQTPQGAATGVVPPVYGQWQAATPSPAGTSPLAPEARPRWPATLNLDPRMRVAAALGAHLVQERQEELVEKSWQYAAQLQDANQLLRQKQLAREVTQSVYEKRLQPLSEAAKQQITAPLVVPQTTASTTSVTRSVLSAPAVPSAGAPDPLLEAVVSAPFRRLARAAGILAPPPTATTEPRSTAPQLTGGTQPVTMSTLDPSMRMNQLVTMIATGNTTGLQLAPPQPQSQIAFAATGLAYTGGTTTISSALRTAAVASSSAATLLEKVDPQSTFLQEAQARIDLPPELQSAWTRPEPLAPLNVTPVFDDPMYESLRDVYTDFLLPGLDRVANNSIQLLEADGQFIESYMVGLNDEMSRVLLWREFPTDLRGTYFRQFWDTRAFAAPDADAESLRDMDPIARWTEDLGGNLRTGRGSGLLVLLIKGDLLTRFPTALIYAAPAVWSKDSAGNDAWPAILSETAPINLPVLRVDPQPGVALLGFNIPGGKHGAVGVPAPPGNAGWFIVLEEHPTEPRFGLAISQPSVLDSWRLLSWKNVPLRSDSSGYIDVAASKPTLVPPPVVPPATAPPPAEMARYTADSRVVWGANGASMAYILLNNAFREEIHASYWLPHNPATAGGGA